MSQMVFDALVPDTVQQGSAGEIRLFGSGFEGEIYALFPEHTLRCEVKNESLAVVYVGPDVTGETGVQTVKLHRLSDGSLSNGRDLEVVSAGARGAGKDERPVAESANFRAFTEETAARETVRKLRVAMDPISGVLHRLQCWVNTDVVVDTPGTAASTTARTDLSPSFIRVRGVGGEGAQFQVTVTDSGRVVAQTTHTLPRQGVIDVTRSV